MVSASPSLLLACCALAACTARGAPDRDEGGPSASALGERDDGNGALAPASVDVDPGPVEPGPDAPMPRPYRKRLAAAVALEAECVGCHAEQAAQVGASLHRRASVDAAYVRALATEPSPFCRGCHAPEADPTLAAPSAASALGVGCVTCHVTQDGFVLAAAPRTDRDERERNEADERSLRTAAPHPLRRSVAFAATGACAGCHEFRFPAAVGDDDRHFMQTTLREHGRSAARDRSCADCHMPLVDGARSHAFTQVRDPAWLARSLTASAERRDGTLRVTLAQPTPGHAFPTGDLFRRIEVGCELRDEAGLVVARDARHLARHFQILPGSSARELVRDDRVANEPVVVELTPTPAAPTRRARIVWWVTHQRVATVGAGVDAATAEPAGRRVDPAVIESETLLHSGELPWDSD